MAGALLPLGVALQNEREAEHHQREGRNVSTDSVASISHVLDIDAAIKDLQLRSNALDKQNLEHLIKGIEGAIGQVNAVF